MLKFKVGDVLTVIPLEEVKKREKDAWGRYMFDGDLMLDDMLKFCSKKVTVEGVLANKCTIEEDGYEWTHDMFEEDKEEEKTMNLELNNLTEEQKKQIIELAKKFEQENEIDKIDFANDWEVTGRGSASRAIYAAKTHMEDLFKLGLTAHTKEEAEKIRRRLLVEKELRDWAKKCKEQVDQKDQKQAKFLLTYDIDSNRVISNWYKYYIYAEIMFTDEKTIKQAIESIGQERLIRDYFGIDK